MEWGRWIIMGTMASVFGLSGPQYGAAEGGSRGNHSPFTADTSGYVDVWPGFVILVWQYRTPMPGPEAKAAYERVNLRGIHLDGGFSDRLLEFAQENHYRYYVDHAAGKGDLYLRPQEWAKFREAYRQNRQRPIRPNCLRDPTVIERLKRLLTENISRAKVGPVVAYAFDDEISVTSFTSPADVCWCERCLAAFRTWLKGQYGTIESLNAEWRTDYTRFDEAEPLAVDDLRENHSRPFDRWNLARWCDHRSFMDATFAEVLADLVAFSNRLDPRVPAGFVGGQAPAAYGGYDYAKLARAVQWMEAYDIGATNEILRSFWGQERPHVQTFFSTFEPLRDQWFLWYYFVHGNRGVICWPDNNGTPWFQGSEVNPAIQALSETFAELQGPLGELLVGAEFLHDGIAVYYSHPSIQVSWFMDIQPHGSTWINRSSSLNNDHATDILNRWAWLKLLEDCGFQYNLVSYLEVPERGLSPDQYRVLLLPRTLALSDREAAALRAYVEAGGSIIADYLCGVFDEHGKGRGQGALDDLFGVTHDFSAGVLDGQNIAEVDAEKYDRPLSEKLNYEGARRRDGFVLYERGLQAPEFPEGGAFKVSRTVGKGRVVDLNLTPLEYLLQRGTPGGQPYQDLMTSLLAQTGLKPRLRVQRRGAVDPLIESLFWRKGDRIILGLIHNALRAAQVDSAASPSPAGGGGGWGPGADGLEPIRLEFAQPVAGLRNERTGRDLGDGTVFEDTWVPCQANLYSFKR